MADIFLSYTEHDRDTVRRLADTLQAVGWTVWWDRRIPAGQTWRDVLERELQSMHCLVVLWSSRSVKSDWVCEEAAEARQRDRLVPVLIERVRPPAGFREVQAADLVDWDGSRDFPGLQQLIGDIEQMIGKPGVKPSETQQLAPVVGDKRDATPMTNGTRDAGRERAYTGRAPAPTSPSRYGSLWGVAAAVLVIAAGIYFVTAKREPAKVIHESRPPTVEQPALLPVKPAPPPVADTPVTPEVKDKPLVVRPVPNLPIAKKADSSQPPVVKPIVRQQNGVNPRCTALTERLALGETLSSEAQSFFNQECRK
jgi:hypothetical protein